MGGDEPGGEDDPLYSPLKRTLVKFWGFTVWNDWQYALVTLYTKEKAVWQHPVLKKYRLAPVKGGNLG